MPQDKPKHSDAEKYFPDIKQYWKNIVRSYEF